MSKTRILFVDDESAVIEGLRRILRKQRQEWDMHFVLSGPEALASMSEAPFDVIVTDMQMPEMDGGELLERVIESHPDTARIVLTGQTSGPAWECALRLAHQFLTKPTDAATLQQAVARACYVQQTVADGDIRALVAGCGTVPSLPSTYVEITEAVDRDDANAKMIGAIIARDMAMSAKLLQLVNSAFFGVGRQVTGIEQAVSLLGLNRIKALVLGKHVFEEFPVSQVLPGLSLESLWHQALMVGELARFISKAERLPQAQMDEAFASGLMHDIGMLIFASREAVAYEEILERVRVTRAPMCELEKNLLGVTHAEVGAYLLGLWGLPECIVEGVAHHHAPGGAAADRFSPALAVHVADALLCGATESGGDGGADPFAAILDQEYIERLGLTPRIEQWRAIVQQVTEPAMEPKA
jgi:HD-like signal output (HDOD) protein/CheY-like chemotaxis protein